MINALFKKVSYVQILVNTSASIAMIVDNIVVGKFLGVKAVGGYGAVAPLLLLIMAVSQVLSTGGQIKCGEELGKGDLKTANGVASLTVFIALIFSFVMIAVCFIFQQPISNILGAESGSELYDHTVNYLLGFIVGAPAFIGMLVLIPFIQLDGDKSCVVRATIGMTIVDCVGDLLAAMVFNAGMFGIGIASSISYYVAFVMLMLHFVRKKGAIRLGFKNMQFKRTGGILTSGIPAALQKVLRTLLTLTLNRILISYGGAVFLGIFTVINSIINLCNSVGQGMGASTLLLSGIFYTEGDRKNLKEVVRSFVKNSLIWNLILMAGVGIAAAPLIVLFSKQGDIDINLASTALRIGITDFILFSLANCFKNYYQGTHKRVLTYVMTITEAFLFSALAAFPLTQAFGLNGISSVYAVGDLLTLITLAVIVCVKNKKFSLRIDNFMLLENDPASDGTGCCRKDIASVQDAADAAVEVGEFVKSYGKEREDVQQLSAKMSLCVEEICMNTIHHGFTPKGKNHLEVFARFDHDQFVLRIRDDCRKYDPVAWYQEYTEKESSRLNQKYGLKIVFGVAENINYFGTLGLNTIVIKA